MRSLLRTLLIALPLAATALPAMAQTGSASQAPPAQPGCLAPIAEGSPDPGVRALHLHLAADPRYVAVTMCIVSGETHGFQSVGATIGVLDTDGNLVNSISASYANVGPLAASLGNAPKLILPFSTAAYIDPKYHDRLANQALVTLQVVICQEALPGCNAGPARTEVLQVPVEIDHDAASAAAPARR